MKNEKCIVFPESRHANWNPAMSNINNRKIFLGNSSKKIPSKKTVEKKSKKLICIPGCVSLFMKMSDNHCISIRKNLY